ncbi:2-oxo acid dehydrogenase subunit E2 [Steroidobacter flavus]|uniref:2-oxo acid dehydrogenase subunit E2 n=1 Tax=Steroidobacter flavus TaxID=1842136 RepID=A0ABV8SYA0_9GAMM
MNNSDTSAVTAIPMSRLRRTIAERLTLSATTVPQFTVTVVADVTQLLQLRAEAKERADGAYSITDFVLAAVARSLLEFPMLNAYTDGRAIWPRAEVNIGVAVDVDGGLLVPVIRQAERLSLRELSAEVRRLAEAARARTLSAADMTGGTFTVSNLGMFGVDEFCAIVNPGESAILAVAAVVPTAVPLGNGFVARRLMKMTLTADHRLIDGALAARFLGVLRGRLEDADAWRSEAES